MSSRTLDGPSPVRAAGYQIGDTRLHLRGRTMPDGRSDGLRGGDTLSHSAEPGQSRP